MRRLLASVSFIALALGVVAIGGVYAPFTGSGPDSGDVAAGDISIRLNDYKGVDEIVYDGPYCQSDNMAPGVDSCTDYVLVRNDGSLDLEYTVSDIETDCFDVSHTGPFDNVNGGDGNDPGHLPGGNTEAETVIVTVVAVGDNDCQGTSASVGISVSATSIPTP